MSVDRAVEYYTEHRLPQRRAAALAGVTRDQLRAVLCARGLTRTISESRQLTATRCRRRRERMLAAGRLYHSSPFVSFADVQRELNLGTSTKTAATYIQEYCSEMGLPFEHPFERLRRLDTCVAVLRDRLPTYCRRKRIQSILDIEDGKYSSSSARGNRQRLANEPGARAICADTLERLGHARIEIAGWLGVSGTTITNDIRRQRGED